jgi:phosphopantothenoylcysteine decarboxylase/phosphopantothenate--cysteine ligase
LDPVRYITNHSTGKMGYAIAKNAMLRGAEVTLVTGETSIPKPRFVEVVDVKSASDMFDAVTSRADKQDIIIKAAAVADYTPTTVSDDKIKKADGELTIPVERTRDILKYLGENKKPNQFLCGFSMETKDMLENSRRKLVHKNLDMIVANNLKVAGAGFGVDTNVITMITPGKEIALEMMSKDEAAEQVLDEIMRMRK